MNLFYLKYTFGPLNYRPFDFAARSECITLPPPNPHRSYAPACSTCRGNYFPRGIILWGGKNVI